MYNSEYEFKYILSKTVDNYIKYSDIQTAISIDTLSSMIHNNSRFDYYSMIHYNNIVHMFFQFNIENSPNCAKNIEFYNIFKTDFAKYINYIQPDFVYKTKKKPTYSFMDENVVIKNPPINEPYLEYLVLASKSKNKTIYRIHFYNMAVQLSDLKIFCEHFVEVFPKYKDCLDTSVYDIWKLLSIPKDVFPISVVEEDNKFHVIEYSYSNYGEIKNAKAGNGLEWLFEEVICASIPCFISSKCVRVYFDDNMFKTELKEIIDKSLMCSSKN